MSLRRTVALVALLPACLFAHHEAIFGPQSAALILKRRFVSTQYYLTSQGQHREDYRRSHIGVLSVGVGVGQRWSLGATLPIEAEREADGGGSIGVHDPVLSLRYLPDVGQDRNMIAVFTFEPPASPLEHRAVGFGSGLIYGAEKGHWSGIVYGLGRTEHSFDRGEKRGNRLFLGSGLAFEAARLPFSPQLGFSWERVGRRRESGSPVEDSKTSALMIHPTFSKTLAHETIQTFFVVSLPVAQWSGRGEGWQRWRIATGVVWAF